MTARKHPPPQGGGFRPGTGRRDPRPRRRSMPILFAIALFALTLGAYLAFRIAERKMR